MNNASFSKRLIAFIIDFIFIGAILMILAYFIPKGNDFDYLNKDMNELTEQRLRDEITFKAYVNEYANYVSAVESDNALYNSISFIILIIYYVVIPLFAKRTLGKQIMKLKYEKNNKNKLNFVNLFIRSIIDIGLLFSLVTVFIVQLVSSKTYLLTLIILGFVQILLVIISIFMILYRRDKRSISDILSRTNVIEVK